MSFRADRNELHLGEIVARALRRRLYPNSLLRPKQLAYDLRISERTIWNLMSGNRPPAGETLWTLCNFFGADMVGEIFGCTIQRPRPHHHRRRAVFRGEGAVSFNWLAFAIALFASTGLAFWIVLIATIGNCLMRRMPGSEGFVMPACVALMIGGPTAVVIGFLP